MKMLKNIKRIEDNILRNYIHIMIFMISVMLFI